MLADYLSFLTSNCEEFRKRVIVGGLPKVWPGFPNWDPVFLNGGPVSRLGDPGSPMGDTVWPNGRPGLQNGEPAFYLRGLGFCETAILLMKKETQNGGTSFLNGGAGFSNGRPYSWKGGPFFIHLLLFFLNVCFLCWNNILKESFFQETGCLQGNGILFGKQGAPFRKQGHFSKKADPPFRKPSLPFGKQGTQFGKTRVPICPIVDIVELNWTFPLSLKAIT